ncbi:hypothetical protein ciss_12370 [Carboxydothermus islandicus]|uniref:Uncharacterized protein n=1 Tax=Carboxydothermus islandicus TaxID=661089 RepID=A0A1L8D2H4_9THEO|nr:hypothetical protein [Carboxydothermus islandicus]GAV25304.1 hypothetical protein ciss_12370 [Carboxydothermus islandicus]
MTNKKKLFLGLSAFILCIIVLTTFYFTVYKKFKSLIPANPYDLEIEKNAVFIPAKNSINFDYKAKILIFYKNPKEDLVMLQHLIEISPKTKETYKNVSCTVFLDKSLRKWILSGPLYFGTDRSQNITINYKTNPGLNLSYINHIGKDFDKNMLVDDLKKPIKIKIKWQNGTEYVELTDFTITWRNFLIKNPFNG